MNAITDIGQVCVCNDEILNTLLFEIQIRVIITRMKQLIFLAQFQVNFQGCGHTAPIHTVVNPIHILMFKTCEVISTHQDTSQ